MPAPLPANENPPPPLTVNLEKVAVTFASILNTRLFLLPLMMTPTEGPVMVIGAFGIFQLQLRAGKRDCLFG